MSQRMLRAFTLIELIVVMAIVVTLSVIGFISYNTYIRDARNAARQSNLDEAVAAIDRFIFNNARAPKCSDSTGGQQSGPAVCYFTPGYGASILQAKSGAPEVAGGAGAYFPVVSGTRVGIQSSEWTQLNLKSNPEDPRKYYYVYATDGQSGYAVFATKEESNGYSPLVRGYKAMPWDPAAPGTDVVKAALWPAGASTVTIYGYRTDGGAFQSTTAPILGDGNISQVAGAVAPVPYKW